MHQPKLVIAIPASLVSDTPHLREKTFRAGLVARAAAIFRVQEILVYRDRAGLSRSDVKLLLNVLQYMETPQYLRKILFPIDPQLRYLGILPPLQTPHHPAEVRGELESGAYREGVLLRFDEGGSMVDVGIGKPIKVFTPRLASKTRVTVRVDGPNQFRLVSRDQVPHYWGYRVKDCGTTLGEALRRSGADLVIATSKHGNPIKEKIKDVADRFTNAGKCLVAFGSPEEGLKEILARENLNVEDVANFIVNMVPNQGTETVRMEEAIYACLAILNTLS